MSLTYHQEKILALVPKFTAGMGLPCELTLIFLIVGDHQKKRANPMLRALAGISFFGFCDALGWFMSTWATPAGSFALAAGTITSCNFQGFLLQFVIGAPMYNCALAYFFYEVIVNDRSADSLLRLEKYIHAAIISYATITAFLLLGLEQYNSLGAVCWVQGYPSGCGNSVYSPSPDAVPCERGHYAWVYGMVLFYIPLWICIVFIIYFNVSIWFRLRHTTEATWFATQSTLYAVAFVAVWAPSTTWSAVGWNNGGGFGLDFASAFCEPLAGVWNLSIFLRNRHALRARIYNFVLCRWDKLRELTSRSDDMEGAPRKVKNKKSGGTSVISGLSSGGAGSGGADKKKKKKHGDPSLDSDPHTMEATWFATQSTLYAVAFVAVWAPSTTWPALRCPL